MEKGSLQQSFDELTLKKDRCPKCWSGVQVGWFQSKFSTDGVDLDLEYRRKVKVYFGFSWGISHKILKELD